MIADLFAGAGGASLGMELAFGRSPDIALNHDELALEMHQENHPECWHIEEDALKFGPDEFPIFDKDVNVMWMSPDCRHFSRAKGKRPVSKKIRSLAWAGVKWARIKRPKIIFLENVAEFLQWGPLHPDGTVVQEKKGLTFKIWLGRLRGLGYDVDWRVLNCADYGAPTSRKRLFLIARCDGNPIVWPEATHGPGRPQPWRTAAECIDWSIGAASIFRRPEAKLRPLAEKTKQRIAHGIMRHVVNDPNPYIAPINGADVSAFFVPRYGERPTQAPRSRDIRRPMPVIVPTQNGAQLVTAFMAKHFGGMVGRSLETPVSTIKSRDSQGIVAANLTKFYGTSKHGAPITNPMPTVTAQGQHTGLVTAFLTKYYSSGGQLSRADLPMHTITTKGRMAMVACKVAGEDYVITDIGMRMLKPHELAMAQGFPSTYKFLGTDTQKIAKIGNSVPPPVVEALVRANIEGTSIQLLEAA